MAWSYSSIKTFEQCPKKYHHTRVLKDVKDEGSEAMFYGNEVHKAAEECVKNGTPIPAKFSYMQDILDALIKIEGDKHCELKLGLRWGPEVHEACGFFDEGVWWRGIVDLLIVNGDKAWMVDYKTGKNAKYADTKQLDLLAAATFAHFPKVQRIKSALAYVVSNEFIRKVHVREEQRQYAGVFTDQLTRLDAAHQTDVWNANPTPLCGWCPVTICPHHRKRFVRIIGEGKCHT